MLRCILGDAINVGSLPVMIVENSALIMKYTVFFHVNTRWWTKMFSLLEDAETLFIHLTGESYEIYCVSK